MNLKKVSVVLGVFGVLSCVLIAHGQVSQSELGDPGAPPPRQNSAQPAFPAPTIEPPPAQEAAPPVATPEPPPAPAKTPAPAPEPEHHDRNRVQSGKPVAAFWTVLPGR